jgi:hypothetical protein
VLILEVMGTAGPEATRWKDRAAVESTCRWSDVVVGGLYALSEREREARLAGEVRTMGEGGFWRRLLLVDGGFGGGAGSGARR